MLSKLSANLGSILVFIPAFFGLISTFVLTWLKDLNAVSKRTRVLTEATQRMEFWSRWAEVRKAQAPLSAEDQARVDRELRRISRTVKNAYLHLPPPHHWTPTSFRAYLREVGHFRRVFMGYSQATPTLDLAKSVFTWCGFLLVCYCYSLAWASLSSVSWGQHWMASASPLWRWSFTGVWHGGPSPFLLKVRSFMGIAAVWVLVMVRSFAYAA